MTKETEVKKQGRPRSKDRITNRERKLIKEKFTRECLAKNGEVTEDIDNINEKFGKIVAKKASRIFARDIVNLIGVNESLFYNILEGRKDNRSEAFFKICKYFGIETKKS